MQKAAKRDLQKTKLKFYAYIVKVFGPWTKYVDRIFESSIIHNLKISITKTYYKNN